MIKICPSVEYFEANLRDALAGRFTTSPQMYVQIPSVYDDTLAPEGRHVMSMWMQLQPVTLSQWGAGDHSHQEVFDVLMDTMSVYAPNIREVVGPVGGADTGGHRAAGGADRREYTAAGHHPVAAVFEATSAGVVGLPGRRWRGLYLCGGGTHPGGEVTGAPGHNAAPRHPGRIWTGARFPGPLLQSPGGRGGRP